MGKAFSAGKTKIDSFSTQDTNMCSASNLWGLFFNDAGEHSYSRGLQNQKRDRIDKV